MQHRLGHAFGLNPLAAAPLAALAAPAAPVFAEEPVELEVVTVSATRAGSGAGETPQMKFRGYSLVDASIGYRQPVGRLTAGVENAFNKDYVTYYSQSADSTTRDDRYFKGRGRTVTVGYQVSF